MTSIIIGATSMAQLKENVGAIGKPLPDECIAEVEAVYKELRDPSLL